VSKTIDALDLKIINSLSQDCRKTTTQIAIEAGTSRPTVIARMNSLAKRKIVDFGAKINVAKLGFKIASVHFETEKTEDAQNIIDKLSACPRLLQLFQEVGKNTFTAIVFAENADTIISAIDCFKIALNATITSWERIIYHTGGSFGLKIIIEKCEKTPCGKECGMCLSFQQSECTGCPATKDYKGPI
jgi:DNA-binding Lrp family transcriptional regulator